MLHERHQSRLGRYLEDKTGTFYHIWALIILMIGVVMDVYLTGLWLPRAGAIVAGVAAWLYFFDPRSTDDWWDLRNRTRPDHLKNDVVAELEAQNQGKPRGVKAAAVQKALMQAEIAKRYAEMAEMRHISYRAAKIAYRRQHEVALRVQAFWLFMGTLIWAFGDVPVELLKCGAVPC